MLSPADLALVQRDTALPHLALLLDPDQMLTALERTLGRRLARPVISYLRYKPGRSCLAACRVEVDGEPVEFSAKHHRLDADKFESVMTRPAVAGPLGPGRFVLTGTTVVVSVFPNDGKLKKLAWLGSDVAVAEMAHRVDGGVPPMTARIHTLHYNPERRFVGRLTVNGQDRATVRCYRRDDYVRAVDKLGRLESRGPLRLARPLLRDERNHVVAMEWLRGRPLEDAIAQQVEPRDKLPIVGAALAELHQQDGSTLASRGAESEAAASLELARDLAEIHPKLETDARRLATQLACRLADNRQRLQPIHGDFYARQVLLDEGIVAVLDLDEAALGDPAIDVGRFRADLESAVIRGRLDADNVHAITESLLEGYALTSGRRPSRIDLQAAAQLLRLATHPFRRREHSWPERSAALLQRARAFFEIDTQETTARIIAPERRVDPTAISSAARPRVSDRFGAAADTSMPFLTGALDPKGMGERFGNELACFKLSERIDIFDIAVTRYKPGRRCLISYDLGVFHGEQLSQQVALVGKIRARGTDHGTHQLQTRLWTDGFGPGAADAISVPEPLGVIASLHMTVQRKVPGAPLERLLDGPHGRHLACRAAEAIDKLHRLSLPARGRRHAVEDEMHILRRRLAGVSEENPGWQDRLDALIEGCQRMASRLVSVSACGIHRDFYPNQLLADGERLYLLDLDLFSEGDPALDLGNFAAHLDEYSLRRFGDADRLADRRQVVIDSYLALSDRTTREAIEAYATLALTRHIAISRQFTDRRPHTEALLALCEERVLGGRATHAAAGI